MIEGLLALQYLCIIYAVYKSALNSLIFLLILIEQLFVISLKKNPKINVITLIRAGLIIGEYQLFLTNANYINFKVRQSLSNDCIK